jgi:hypothetical protein
MAAWNLLGPARGAAAAACMAARGTGWHASQVPPPWSLPMPDAAGALHPPLKAALVDIVVDDQRHILYTRSQSSVLQVRVGGGVSGGGGGLTVQRAAGVCVLWGSGEGQAEALLPAGLPHRRCKQTRATAATRNLPASHLLNPAPFLPLFHPGQVFDLGADGKAAPSRAADSSDFLHDAARALGGRDVFGRGGEPGPTCRRGALPGFGGCSASLPRMG